MNVTDDVDLRRRRRKRRGTVAVVGAPVALLLFIAWSNWHIAQSGKGRIHTDLADVPVSDVAVVLGTTPGTKSKPNVFFDVRIDAGAELFLAGKVKGVVVSGDHSLTTYNETEVMKRELIARGVPAAAITKDDAGLRTLDSVVRSRKVFGLRNPIFVSQDWHLERTLFLADAHGYEAQAYATVDVTGAKAYKANLRELLARVRAHLDVWLGTEPKFLGKKEHVRRVPRHRPTP